MLPLRRYATSRSCTAAISAPRGAVSGRARTFHRPVDRDQSRSLSAAAAAARNLRPLAGADRDRAASRRSPRKPTARRRPAHVGGGAGHANSAAAGRRPGAARARRDCVADLCASTRARRALAGHGVTETRDIEALGDADLAIVGNPEQSGRAAHRPRSVARARRQTAPAPAVFWSSTRPSWMSDRRREPCRRCRARQHRGVAFVRQVLRPCRRTARFCACRAALGGAAFAPCSVPGRFPGRRWRSARRRWRIPHGSRARDAAWPGRRDGSMPISIGGGLDIVGGTNLFRLARTPAAAGLFEHLGGPASWRAFLRIVRTPRHGCASACRRTTQLAGRLQIAIAAFATPARLRHERAASADGNAAEAALPAGSFDHAFRARLRDLLVWRRDVRRFRRDPLPGGTLEALIELACLAPSVGLSQPWRFVIVDDDARRAPSGGILRPATPPPSPHRRRSAPASMRGSSSPAWKRRHVIWRCSPIARPRKVTVSDAIPCRR